jgi:hypothetical protein
MPKPSGGRKSAITVRGAWFPMPIEFLRSRACATLSPQALKMLIDLCAQMGPNARGNGDLTAAATILAPRGWTSAATRSAAVKELIDTGLLVITRMGNRRRCNLYAVTLWPMDCDFAKLDHGPGCYATDDWAGGPGRPLAAVPSAEAPASWSRLRKNEISVPATGQPTPVMNPPRVNLKRIA